MYYPDELVEEVRMRNDIVDVISGYVKLQKKGGNYFGLCPFHSEKSPSFSVSSAKQMYYCFGCGAGGNVVTFIMQYENYTFQEALKLLAERAGVALPEAEYSEEARKKDSIKLKILELNKIAAKYYYYQLRSEKGKQGLDYFGNRGLSQDTMQKFGLGFANKNESLYQYIKKQKYSDELIRQSGLVSVDEKRGMSDKFWNRVIFPIMDVNHRVVGFGGRVMGEGMPKYLNSPETLVFDKSRNLYGLNHARTSRRRNMIICEGYMDVIALHQAGFTQAVASLGTAFTSGQAGLLKRYTEEVLLTYDSDSAGVKAALRALPILKEAGLTAKVINMEPYKDPDEFIEKLGTMAFEERIAQAENSFFYEVRILERDYDLKDPESKTKFCREIAKKLLSFSEELERENYLQAIADKYFLNSENLKKLVIQSATKGSRMQQPEKPKSGIKNRKDPMEGVKKAQRLLLTWLVDEKGAYEGIKPYISPIDFTEDLYKTVAVILFKQLEEDKLNPASIINQFTDEEEQREAAALFNTTLTELTSKQEREKALTDVVKQVKKYTLEQSNILEFTDGQDLLTKLAADRKAIEALERLHISLD